jgi:4-hydroxy-tetrahydrodipicolinate reductase
MIKLAISGCHGRMGQRITALALQDKAFKITALLESKQRADVGLVVPHIPVNFEDAALKGSDVLIEFTTPQATMEHLKACRKYGLGMVIGTTGFTKPQLAQIKKAALQTPIVLSSNMSVGVNLVFGLIRRAAEVTAGDYIITLTETHHVHKKDAPSGTAKTMAQIAEAASRTKVKSIQSRREGEVIGDHTITFESPVDTISMGHHAKTRDIFAQGALVAAKFLSRKKNGLFDMQDVLGLK